MDNKYTCKRCGGSGEEPEATEVALQELASLGQEYDAKDALCSDCPPANYPTDKTRCTPCPRRK